jgi:hypothetical protein
VIKDNGDKIMKVLQLIGFVIAIISLVSILVDQYPEKELYIVAASLMAGAIWLLLDFLKLREDILGKEKIFEYINAKKYILIYIFFGIILGYFWGHEGEKPPHEIWLDSNKNIAVVQKPRGSVYTFEPIGDGYYKLFSVNKQVNNEK